MSEKDVIGIYELDELYICHRYRSVVEKNKADKNAMISLLAELNGCTPRRIRECLIKHGFDVSLKGSPKDGITKRATYEDVMKYLEEHKKEIPPKKYKEILDYARECQKKIECADLFIKSLKNTKNLEQKHLHKLYEALGSHQKGDVVL